MLTIPGKCGSIFPNSEPILKEVDHPYHEAAWIVSFVIEQFKLELRWLRKLAREIRKRGPARRASYAVGRTEK